MKKLVTAALLAICITVSTFGGNLETMPLGQPEPTPTPTPEESNTNSTEPTTVPDELIEVIGSIIISIL